MISDVSRALTSARLENPGGLYSQSNNFLGVVQSAVDPRTGQFNLAITLPAVHANELGGPSFALTLSFSPLSSLQDYGYGLGWSALVSALTLKMDMAFLTLSSGEHFSVDRDASGGAIGSELVFADHKLKSRKVTKLSADSYRVDSKSGEVEILERLGGEGAFLLREMRSPEGRRMFFAWRPDGKGGHTLSSISDASRTLLEIKRETGRVHFVFDPGSESPHTIELRLLNSQLSNIMLPGFESSFHITYELIDLGAERDFLFPKQTTSPLGAIDTITWSSRNNAHQLPTGAPVEYVPRVVAWKQSTGASETTLHHSYRWIGNTNHYGYGSQAGFVWDEGRDNLYKVQQNYQYSVVETLTDKAGTTLVTITRQWNRFHLQTRENTVRGQAQVQVSTVYHDDPDLSWEAQPAYCQLPHIVTTTYYQDAQNQRSEAIEYRYDDYGNVIYTRFPTGVIEQSLYHPAEGCDDAPQDPLGMVRLLSRKTTTPADHSAPTLYTTYRYENLASLLPGEYPRAVVVEEQSWNQAEGQLLERTLQTYIRGNGPDYGRLDTSVTHLNGRATTTRYVYTTEADRLRTQMIIEGHDFDPNRPVSRSMTSDSRSLFTGQTLDETSPAGVVTSFRYDLLGRIIQTVIAEGSEYEAKRTCDYHVADAFVDANRPRNLATSVGLEETDASGQRRRTWLDGKGRVVGVELENLDHAEGTFREISRTSYDPLGRVITQTTLEWLADGTKAFEFCTRTAYDDWGNACCMTSPSGVISHLMHDPIKMRTMQWEQATSGKRTAKRVTRSNVSGSMIREDILDDQNQVVRATVFKRDGLDRIVERRIKVPRQQDIVTRYHYDSYARVVEQVLPDNTRVAWTYAAHSDGEHPESVKVIEVSLDR